MRLGQQRNLSLRGTGVVSERRNRQGPSLRCTVKRHGGDNTPSEIAARWRRGRSPGALFIRGRIHGAAQAITEIT